MGVTGLWPILHPCARPTKLETLNRKRLAVDASIWIYQFLKAVRDKEGNALRNSHVVGFFRRICKLLFFGIKPVFVFDGGAPALKRQTVLGRKRRREGRRDDAVRTAGKLLAVQMQRRLEEDEEKRTREREVRGQEQTVEEEEQLPADHEMVYVDELAMSNQERQRARKFTRTDAYHLPDLDGGIENMGQPNDPRIMSAEELEEYARQFDSGEDINLYDFSKIDFNGEFFMSLPAVDRYNILNAARLRSRLRMGLSKDQLEEMFPDRMAFSRFQIERVRERNDLTQRLMHLNGMNDDAMWGVTNGGRIAGERDREYVLVKNDGVEGGWALGVVTTDKKLGERSKPIDVDSLSQAVKLRQDEDDEDDEDDDDFEDIPVEGLNRLSKIGRPQHREHSNSQGREIEESRRSLYSSQEEQSVVKDIDSMFIPDDENLGTLSVPGLNLAGNYADEEERDLSRAIAMSLQTQHAISESEDETADFEDVPLPRYEQKAVEEPKPIIGSSGHMVAHIVNNRANAAVPKRKAIEISGDSDDDMDFGAVLAASMKQNKERKRYQLAPITSNTKNPFDGPLPFEKLDFRTSLFSKRNPRPEIGPSEMEIDDEAEGGFQRDNADEASKPLPPWMVKTGDIRSDVREQRARDVEMNAEDRAQAEEEARIFRRDFGVIEVDSSDDESDLEIVDARVAQPKEVDLEGGKSPPPLSELNTARREVAIDLAENTPSAFDAPLIPSRTEQERDSSPEEYVEWSDSDREEHPVKALKAAELNASSADEAQVQMPNSESQLDTFEDTQRIIDGDDKLPPPERLSPVSRNVVLSDTILEVAQALPLTQAGSDPQQADMVPDDEFGEFSDTDDEELFAQLATEAEEHARFASTLNSKSARENQEAYERELKTLRNQQKKDRRDADEVSHIMITECQALLSLFGLPYITAPMEAEAQCAELVRLGLVDGIVTDDSDIFLFGGTRVYKNMFNSNKFVECYLAPDMEKELSLSRHQLISIAHLLGSDYTEGLPGVGPVTAVEILSEFPSDTGLEEFKAWWSDVQMNSRSKDADSHSSFRKKFRRAQATKLFLPPAFPSPAVTEAYLSPEVDSDPESFQWGVPDLDKLRDFLMITIGWTRERTDEVLVPVIRDMNRREAEGTQSNITRYFEGAVGVGARDNFAPRIRAKESVRMKEAVKKLKSKKDKGLSGTFADEAADWAKRNELSATAEAAKKAERNKAKAEKKSRTANGKGHAKNTRPRSSLAGDDEDYVSDAEQFSQREEAGIKAVSESAEVEDAEDGEGDIGEDEYRSHDISHAKMNGKGSGKGKGTRAQKRAKV